MLLVAGLGGALALIIIIGLVLVLGGGSNRVASNDPAEENGPDAEEVPAVRPEDTAPKPANSTEQEPADTPAAKPVINPQQQAAVWNRLQSALVRIVADTPDGTRTGLGFVVNSTGWIATNDHLLRRARSVSVETAYGKKTAATGLVNSDANSNVAIIEVPTSAVLAASPLPMNASWNGSKGNELAVMLAKEFDQQSVRGVPYAETMSSVKLPPHVEGSNPRIWHGRRGRFV